MPFFGNGSWTLLRVFGVMTWATSELLDEGATGLAMEIRKAADYVVRNASKAYFTSLSI